MKTRTQRQVLPEYIHVNEIQCKEEETAVGNPLLYLSQELLDLYFFEMN